jgi:type IX secretion system PorP/SprF family membrane protein
MRRLISISILALLVAAAKGQDPQFTQFYASPLYLAPSYAGGTPGQRIVANYRNQWSFVPGTFQTYSISYDHNFVYFKSGLGLILLGDVAGDGKMGTTMGGIVYSYDITPHPDFHIRPGIGFYYIQHSIDYSRLIFGDQLLFEDIPGVPMPPSIQPPPGNPVIRDIDVSTSVLAYSDNVWLGATWDHMLRPERTFYGGEDARTNFKFSMYGGARIVLRGIILRPIEESITTAFNLKFQGFSKQLDLGLYWYRQPFLFGTWYRGIPLAKKYPGSDAVAFLFGYKYDDWSVAYSYDFTVSRLGFGSGGSHEIAVIYTFKVKTRKRYRAIPCPTF